jgi:hypothetical protein
MFSPQAWGVATGRHSVTTHFGVARPIVGYGCWWWWRSLLIVCHRRNIAFTSHRVTTCGVRNIIHWNMNLTALYNTWSSRSEHLVVCATAQFGKRLNCILCALLTSVDCWWHTASTVTVKFEVYIAVLLKIQMFWDVILSLVSGSWHLQWL